MNFEESMQYLLRRLPMYQRVGKAAYKVDLDNTIKFCEALDNPHLKFPSVHLAGTNGKGSVSSMLAAVFGVAGYKVGLYTSPHLKSFTERIRINGEPVSEKFVASFVTKHQAFIEELNPSYFETTFAMAIDYFAESEVDIAIIETGLGGRLDSTNVISPLLSIITNIGWDHSDLLGDTLVKIAGEKAGIIKQHTPVIIGESHPETKPVFIEKAQLCEAPIAFADSRPEQPQRLTKDWHGQHFSYRGKSLYLDLGGDYQQYNLNTCLFALEQLNTMGWKLPWDAIQQGLSEVKERSGLRGRMEVLQEKPLIVCDTAHNQEGIQQVLGQLQASQKAPLGILLGMVNDKDHDSVLTLFPKEATYFFAKPNVPRGLDANLMQEKAKRFGLKGSTYADVQQAYQALKDWLPEEGLGFVGGSTFTVAEVV